VNFKVDENLPTEGASVLNDAGHNASTIIDEAMEGVHDIAVLERCASAQRILVTLDLDFGDIRAYPPDTHSGIVILRPHRQDKKSIMHLITGLLSVLDKENPTGSLWIVEPGRIRIHEE